MIIVITHNTSSGARSRFGEHTTVYEAKRAKTFRSEHKKEKNKGVVKVRVETIPAVTQPRRGEGKRSIASPKTSNGGQLSRGRACPKPLFPSPRHPHFSQIFPIYASLSRWSPLIRALEKGCVSTLALSKAPHSLHALITLRRSEVDAKSRRSQSEDRVSVT